jgi:hypothetical protein
MAFLPALPATISGMVEHDDDPDKSPVIGVHRMKTRMRKEASTSVETQFRKNEIRRFLLSEMAKETDCVDIKNGHRPTTCRGQPLAGAWVRSI